jgi:hypothetical protein
MLGNKHTQVFNKLGSKINHASVFSNKHMHIQKKHHHEHQQQHEEKPFVSPLEKPNYPRHRHH